MRQILTVPGQRIWPIAASVAVPIVVTALLIFPSLWIAVGCALALPVFLRADGRLLIFSIGVLGVFQSSDGISATKVLFLVLLGLIGTVATLRTLSHLKHEWAKPFKPPLIGSGVIVGLVILETIVGVLHGASLSDIIRDGVTYIIIAAAVPIGLDAASKLSVKSATVITMCITCFAGISLMVSVLAARGVSSLSLTRVGLPSLMALAVGVSLCLVRALESRRKTWFWLVLAAIQIVFVLTTGSRAGLVLLAAGIVGISFVAQGKVGIFRFLGSVVAFGGALVLTFNFIVTQVTTSAFINSRIEASLQVLQQGSLTDQSGVIRARAATYAINAWSGNTLVGVGFGHIFPDPNPGGGTANYQLDTSALYLAKFGLIGSAILLGSMILILTPAFKRLMHSSRFPEQTVVVGAGSVWLLQLFFGSPTEDKGFSLAIMMVEVLMAAAARQYRLRTSPEQEPSSGLRSRDRSPAAIPETIKNDYRGTATSPKGRQVLPTGVKKAAQ